MLIRSKNYDWIFEYSWWEFDNLEHVFSLGVTELKVWLIMAVVRMGRDIRRTREEKGWPAYYDKAELWRAALKHAHKQTRCLSPMCHLLCERNPC